MSDTNSPACQHDWTPWYYSEEHHVAVHRCHRCGALDGAYPWRKPSPESAASASAEGLQNQDLAGVLEALRRDLDSQNFSPGKMRYFDEVLHAMGATIAGSENADSKQTLARMQTMMTRFADSFANPAQLQEAKQSLGPRCQQLLSRISNFKLYAMNELANPSLLGAEVTSASLQDLALRCMNAQNDILTLKGDGDGIIYEKDNLRHIAKDLQEFSLRNHLCLAQPIWRIEPLSQNVNAVFYSGRHDNASLLSTACRHLQLHLLEAPMGTNHAQSRWNMIRQSYVCVFDFTSYERDEPAKQALPSAAAAYELGIALTLGRPALVLAREQQALPFDIDLQALRLQGDGSDAQRMTEALDELLYGRQRAGDAEESLTPTHHYLQTRLAASMDCPVTSQWLHDLEQSLRDPIRFRQVLEPLMPRILGERHLLIHPSWVGAYPDSQSRCFHVTAFRNYTESVAEVIRRVCSREEVGAEYVRGDERTSADISRAIWNDIARSAFIIADITSLNANAMLELGIAHTLGRRTAILAQDLDASTYPESLQKLRIIRYDWNNPSSLEELEDFLFQFFTEPPA